MSLDMRNIISNMLLVFVAFLDLEEFINDKFFFFACKSKA